jgi:hypothetical protein
MAGVGVGRSLTWDEWVEQGQNAADTETCLLEFLKNEQDPVMRSDIALASGTSVGKVRHVHGHMPGRRDRPLYCRHIRRTLREFPQLRGMRDEHPPPGLIMEVS